MNPEDEAEELDLDAENTTDAEDEQSDDSPEALLEQANAKIEEHWDRILRMQAEQDNLRKRHTRDLEKAHKYGADDFVKAMLPVKDSLEMGIQVAGEATEVDAISEGMQLTEKMFTDALEKIGVTELDPVGEKLNPEHHQAMSMLPSDEHEPNTIMTVMQKGYLLNDRLMRPAMVVVAKAPEEE